MSPPEPTVIGPEQATERDIDGLNRLFSEAFTDRYHRDGLMGVQVPHLHHDVWRYALEASGAGAMVWREPHGELAAFNMVHRSGVEGWMGPLSVRPSLQGLGLGRRVVTEGLQWLQMQGAERIGLETMPRTVDNIGFYAGLGFRPGHLTVTMNRVQEACSDVADIRELSASGDRSGQMVEDCHRLIDSLERGVDYSRELLLTEELRLGDTTVLYEGDRCRAFALWHSVPLALRGEEEVRVLKLVADGLDSFETVLRGVGGGRRGGGLGRRVSVRCQTVYSEAYAALIQLGFRVHWTDLRMLHGEHLERSQHGVVFSNWEI